MSGTSKENAIIVDSDDDCKPTAAPPPRRSKRKRVYLGRIEQIDDRKPAAVVAPPQGKRRRHYREKACKTRCANQEDEKNGLGNGISGIDPDLVVVIDSESDDEIQMNSVERLEPSSRSVTRKPGPTLQHHLPNDSTELCSDLMLAKSLQEQEKKSSGLRTKANPKQEFEQMKKSPYGKAVIAVQRILSLTSKVKKMKQYQKFAEYIDPVSTDDMVFLAKNLLETQSRFIEKNIPAYIDVGFHFTNASNLDSIRTNGLMTKNERDSRGIKSDKYNGSTYGDGIYTSNYPSKFSKYGDTGLIVGRLVGNPKIFQPGSSPGGHQNTVVVPQVRMFVLKTSSQCLPMIKYDKTLVTSEEGQRFAKTMRKSLQRILDDFFNPGLTAPPKIPRDAGSAGTQQVVLKFAAPEKLSGGIKEADAFCSVPASCDFKNDCVICHETLSNNESCVALKACNHVFHKDCIQKACQFGSKCPTCRISIGTPIGKSPSGSMTVGVNIGLKCGGYPTCDTLAILYQMKSGAQKHYHENPGQPYSGKRVSAYLPNNMDGQNLLKRLKFAFLHGLTFTVGTSMTTGALNQCTWSSIHHKTSPNGGTHGFPDPNYFINCNGELDSLDVPAAHELDGVGKKIVKWKLCCFGAREKLGIVAILLPQKSHFVFQTIHKCNRACVECLNMVLTQRYCAVSL